MTPPLGERAAVEGLGTAFLLMTVVGSGIMAERLAGGNVALALLANALATGATLSVLILVLAPVSGAHLNPAVTLVFALRGEIEPVAAGVYVLAQVLGDILGVASAHLMFDLPILAVGLYILSAYWFTASTSFANPAVTVARMLTTSFAGIRPADAAVFVLVRCGVATTAGFFGRIRRRARAGAVRDPFAA